MTDDGLIFSMRRGAWRTVQALRGAAFARTRLRWLARCAMRPLFNLSCTVTMNDGARFRLGGDPLDEVIIADTYGPYHPLYFPIEPADFPAGAWILDLGAHHGVFSVMALHRYPQARLIAVEPDPVGAAALRRNLELNGQIDRTELVVAAIAAQDGTAMLSQSAEGSWGNELVDAPDDANAMRVQTLRLDSILKGRKPCFVKCNAEGAEFVAIPQLLSAGIRPQALSLFIHPAAGDGDRLLQQLRHSGYRIDDCMGTPDHPRYVCRLALDR